MNYKMLDRLFAFASFILAMAVYMLTVQPSVPFWDCSEFASASIWQQVPHPPGAPLFLLLGKMFHLFIPFGDPGWRLNMLAVVSSAATVFLIYLITVKVIENFSGKPKTLGSALSIYISGFIAAGALTFSDTFWFNAVESEVYATSTLFVALITYLMMRWNEKAEEHRSEKYLLLIFYLIGLSSGVHLLAILTVFSVFTIVFFRKYDMKTTKNFWGKFIGMGILAIITFFIIYPFVIKYIPAFLAGRTSGINNFGEYARTNDTTLTVFALGVIIAAIAGFAYSVVKKNTFLSMVCTSFLLIILGYTTYTQILIRSNSNTPMNENEPKNFAALASYLGREQYGNAPTKERRYQTERRFVERYLEKDAEGEFKYGPWTPPKFNYQTGENEWDPNNKSGDWAYLWKYQSGHMYWRYFGWNFIGRKSDVQDAGVATFEKTPDHYLWNHESSYADEFPVRFWAIPFAIGFIGLIFHFYRDPKRALAFLFLFLLTGILSALSQNQQDPQPRERDYFYAASFMIWAMWIGVGTYTFMTLFKEKELKWGTPVIGLIALLAVPINMGAGGWKIHSRAGNYLPFDYSYNILQSCEQDAIIFTNGDNDTFPVWYLQDVMGVRRDIRVVNLSLGQTPWYIDQLKNRSPWGAKKIPLSFSDEMLQVSEYDERAIQPYRAESSELVTVPVKPEILAQYTDDSATIASGKMQFEWVGRQGREGMQTYYVNHQLVKDIIKVTKFERPVYYSTTVGPDVFCGLNNHLRIEGMAWRVCPVEQGGGYSESMNLDVMYKSLMETDNTNNYHTEQHYGFKFRNLDNSGVYYDEVHRRLMFSYRGLYYAYAMYVLDEVKDKELTVKILDKMNENISPIQFPIDYDMAYRVARIYDECGAETQRDEMAQFGLADCQYIFEHEGVSAREVQREKMNEGNGPRRVAALLYEMMNDFDSAKEQISLLQADIDNYFQQIQQAYQTKQSADLGRKSEMLYMTLISMDFEMELMDLRKVYHEDGLDAALKSSKDVVQGYLDNKTARDSAYADRLEYQIKHLQREEWGVKDDDRPTLQSAVIK